MSRPPLHGYNHNLRHGSQLFHVQTEDSGIGAPHVNTHIFSGGTIIASRRSDYRADDDEVVVRQLMQVQHKAMLRELRDGAFDDRIRGVLGTAWVGQRSQPPLGSHDTLEEISRELVAAAEQRAPQATATAEAMPLVRPTEPMPTPRVTQPLSTADADGVVVTRPSVVVGLAEAETRRQPAGPDPVFGDDDRDVTLDEAILAYLSDDAQK